MPRGGGVEGRSPIRGSGSFALVFLLGVVVLPLVGAARASEVGETGIFALPFAAAGTFAVTGADFLYVRRRRDTSGSRSTTQV